MENEVGDHRRADHACLSQRGDDGEGSFRLGPDDDPVGGQCEDAGGQSGGQTTTPAAPAVGVPQTGDAVTTIKRLLAENVAQQKTDTTSLAGLKAQETDLQRLLAAAKAVKGR